MWRCDLCGGRIGGCDIGAAVRSCIEAHQRFEMNTGDSEYVLIRTRRRVYRSGLSLYGMISSSVAERRLTWAVLFHVIVLNLCAYGDKPYRR